MLVDRLAGYAAARNIHYGWVVAALGFLYVLFSTSALGVTAVLVKPMSEQLGLSFGELSASQGLRFALFGLTAPFAGGLLLRYGMRRMVAVSGAVALVGLLMTATMTTRFEMWLGFGVLLGIAPGLIAMQLAAVISSRWFTTHRGLVVGLLNGAIATGTLLFMPLAAFISEHWGWRAALIPSTAGLLVMMGLFIALTRDRPQELGLAPLGETVVPPIPPRPTGNFVLLSFRALRLGAARLVFWVLSATFFICGISSYGLTQTHFVP
jgi:MFS family permease